MPNSRSTTRIAQDLTQRLDNRFGRSQVEFFGGIVTLIVAACVFALAHTSSFTAPVPPYVERTISWTRCEWMVVRHHRALVLVGKPRLTLDEDMWAGRYDPALFHDAIARAGRARAWFDPGDPHAIRGLLCGAIWIDPAVGRQLQEELRRGNREGASWVAAAMGILGGLAVINGVRLWRRGERGQARTPAISGN